ncbi:hypothetical protein ENBRE01_1273 [Enteropsectra breve]|nr:hypothetical protein ENBRE01_1273 [Enteropsectra breve]
MENLAENHAELTWSRLNLTTEKNELLLDNVSGQISPGTLTALMGPSGAGKTTLLNALAGRLPPELSLSGSILLNGRERDPVSWPKTISYVNQQFFAYEWNTVYETLEFVASAKMKASEKIIRNTITGLLKELKLQGVRNTLVRHLSGGEKMRLSICAELLGDPRVIFMDEPTSGLDSYNALKILEILRKLAAAGKTIVMTIHQPSYRMARCFDRMILMGKGNVLFDGNITGCIEFFSNCGFDLPANTNPTDFFLDIISHDGATVITENDNNENDINDNSYNINDISYVNDSIKDMKMNNIEALKTEWERLKEEKTPRVTAEISNKKTAQTGQSFLNLVKREFCNIFRSRAALVFRIIQKLLIAIVFSSAFYGLQISKETLISLRGAVTFLIMNGLYGITAVVLNKFNQDKRVIEREIMSGLYGGHIAYLSKLVAEYSVSFMIEMPAIAVIYAIVRFNFTVSRFLGFLGIFMCLWTWSVSFGLLVSILAPDATSAHIIVVTCNIIFTIYSGMLHEGSRSSRLSSIMMWISPASYIFRALLYNQLAGTTIDSEDGKMYLEKSGLSSVGPYASAGILLGICLVLQICGAVGLHRKTKNNLNIKSNSLPRAA